MRRLVRLVLRATLALTLATGAASLPSGAMANAKYASMVVDMDTGATLRTRNADKRLYPASLTKMMTLYMTFEAIEDGRLSLDQHLHVSRNAAKQPPSKIGLRAGRSISVRHAIRACAVKSANDVAVVLAEAIGGSTKNFALMMTAKARSLGMHNTTFKNPHGLTQKGQLSTARDMAILGQRLFNDFPQFYNVFERRSFTWGKRTYRATNKLLGRYRGADGIKTGYTRASGYNLVASAERDGRRVLGVVFGGRSSASRNRHMMKILDQGFAALPKRVMPRADEVQVAFTPLPRLNPRHAAETLIAMPRPNPRRAEPTTRTARAVIPRGVLVSTAHAAAPRPDGAYAVQIGAYRKRAQARARLDAAEQLRPASLAAAMPVVSVRTARGRPLYAARYAGLRQDEAARACRTLDARGVDCFVIKTR